jgi:hypothetical protein
MLAMSGLLLYCEDFRIRREPHFAERGELSKHLNWVCFMGEGEYVKIDLNREGISTDVSYDGVPARPIPSSNKALCTFRTAFDNLKRSFLVHNSAISVVYAA